MIVPAKQDFVPPSEGVMKTILDRCADLDPARVAIAHPCDETSLRAAVAARKAGLIEPLLVGPRSRIFAVAEEADVDVGGIEIREAAHSHEAAAIAVEIVRSGDATMLAKGSLHTDEFMHAAMGERGLRTDRRISHVYVMDVPGYPRPLLVTDGAVNITPSLAEKRWIVQNAIDLARILGIARPKVAVLAPVEVVEPRLQTTIDAAALAKMADRGQITGGIVDGPFALDNAVSAEAATGKGLVSPVAGCADVLVVPDLVTGNVLAKQLTFLSHADAAAIVVGAAAPIVLTSRADNLGTHVMSYALARLAAERSGTAGKEPQA